MTTLKVSNTEDFIRLINKFRVLLTANVNTLQDIAQDDSEPFVIRQIINMMTSEDEKTALEGINFVFDVATTAANLQMSNDVEGKLISNGTYQLTESQNKIYKKLKGQIKTDKIGDEFLIMLLATYIDRYNTCNAILSFSGVKMEFKSGAQQVRPETTVVRDCADNIQKIIRSLGISSEGKISEKEKPKKSTIMQLIGQAK